LPGTMRDGHINAFARRDPKAARAVARRRTADHRRLFLRKLPTGAADELADVLISRHEKASTLITSNRGLDDWAKLLGDVVIVAPLIDRLMHHGHLLEFDGKRWHLKEAVARIAKASSDN
jgi:hypothetical protein